MKRLLTILTILVFVGAGCYQVADQLATEAVKPVTVPIKALDKAKTTVELVDDAQQKAAAAAADPITVAYIVTEGHEVPTGVRVGETIGCNDRLGYVTLPRRQEIGDELTDALFTLLDFHASTVHETYNALAESRLTVEKTVVKDGTTEVYLNGTITSGGTCDDPRIKNQVEATVALYAPKYKIMLNGTEANWRCLGNMSGECK